MDPDLLALLQDAWFECNAGERVLSFEEIYAIYENVGEEPRNEISGGYASTLARNMIAVHETADGLPKGGGVDTGAGYIWFPSPRYESDGARERVVLHACPYERVVATWLALSKEVMKAQGRFSEVNSGKFMTLPCYQAGRHDTVIIYTKTKAARDAVVREVRHLMTVGTFKQGHFVSPLPRGLREEMPGVGYGSEPPNIQILERYAAKPSYGKYLSQVVSIAIHVAVGAGITDWLGFQPLAAYVLMLAGFDPQNPHDIHEPDAAFLRSIPWRDPAEGRDDRASVQRHDWARIVRTFVYQAALKERVLKPPSGGLL